MFCKYLSIIIYYQHCLHIGSRIYPKVVAMNDVIYHSTPKALYANWGLKNHGTNADLPARQQKTLEIQSIGSQTWNLSPTEENYN